jgi:hypothetical protein
LESLCQTKTKTKIGDGACPAQVLEHLSSKHKALHLNPSTAKK